ncbi:50S ribosomal protein L31 [Candidatus Gracilibacteria bacterium]|nr:50S ribosomal protein L31 [Candidatus Gracilibacteria bacterium]
MKSEIHPTVHKKIAATCSCGASFVFDSTVKAIKTEICSACHPFYTGKQKLVDTAGKVDKFRARMKAAETAKDSKKKSKISESVKAAAVASSARRGSAVDSKRAVHRVGTAAKKRELSSAKAKEKLVVDNKQSAEKEVRENKKDKSENSKATEKKEV